MDDLMERYPLKHQALLQMATYSLCREFAAEVRNADVMSPRGGLTYPQLRNLIYNHLLTLPTPTYTPAPRSHPTIRQSQEVTPRPRFQQQHPEPTKPFIPYQLQASQVWQDGTSSSTDTNVPLSSSSATYIDTPSSTMMALSPTDQAPWRTGMNKRGNNGKPKATQEELAFGRPAPLVTGANVIPVSREAPKVHYPDKTPPKYGEGSRPCYVYGKEGHGWTICTDTRRYFKEYAVCSSIAHEPYQCAQRYRPRLQRPWTTPKTPHLYSLQAGVWRNTRESAPGNIKDNLKERWGGQLIR